MLKDIYLEQVNNKSSLYISDHCVEDPKILSELELKKFKRKVINNYHWHNDTKMANDYKYLDKFISKKI